MMTEEELKSFQCALARRVLYALAAISVVSWVGGFAVGYWSR